MINKILVYECVSRRNKTIHVLDPGDFFCEHNNRIFFCGLSFYTLGIDRDLKNLELTRKFRYLICPPNK